MHRTIALSLLMSAAGCGDTVISDGDEGGAPHDGGSGGAGAGVVDPFAGAGGVVDAGGYGGKGGSGGEPPPECSVPSDCGVTTECLVFSCDAGVCGVADLQGQWIDDPEGNCVRLFCDANMVNTQVEPSDVPPATACVEYYCDGLTLVAVPQLGNPCSGGLCDGSGDCVACLADPSCASWPCPAYDQLPGDCVQKWCADEDTVLLVSDDADLPDTPDCTTIYSCDNGVLESSPAAEGSPCHDGDGACAATGECACVANCECAQAFDCVTNQLCVSPTCDLGFCGFDPVTGGALSPVQQAGNCYSEYCGDSGVFYLPNGVDAPPPIPCNIPTCGPGGPYIAVGGGVPCPGGFCDGVFIGTCYPCFSGAGTCATGSHCDPSAIGYGTFCVPD